MVWDSIPSQRAKENHKFVYGLVKEGSRAKDYEIALSWLVDCGRVIPIEVKAEENLQAKSLKVFNDKFNPGISVRISMSDFRTQEWLINLPLYAQSKLIELLS